MDIQEKRKEIQALIDNIKDHSDRLKGTNTLPLLELSVILSKITKLHEKTLILKYLAAVDQNHEEEEFGVKHLFQKKSFEEEDEQEEKPKEKPQKKPIEVPSSDVVKKEKVMESESSASISSIDEIEAKQEISGKPDLNEAFTEADDPSLSEQLKKQPITDLLTAIGLNERYLYTNELFEGDIEEFRKVIRILNEFERGEEAKEYFNNELRKSYGWESDNKMAKALYLLVLRRYN